MRADRAHDDGNAARGDAHGGLDERAPLGEVERGGFAIVGGDDKAARALRHMPAQQSLASLLIKGAPRVEWRHGHAEQPLQAILQHR